MKGEHIHNKVLILAFLLIAAGLNAVGQCIPDPDGRTALRFHNESSYDVRFFIDEVYEVTLSPAAYSDEFAVVPGEHLLSAAAVIDRVESWVHVSNEVPAGNVCIWHVVDPAPAGLAQRRTGGGFSPD